MENWHAPTAHAQYFNRRPFVHVVSPTKTNFPAGRCLFPLVWKTIFFHFNTTKQDRLELCHSELASVSVTIQIRSFPLLLVAIWMCSFLNPHVSKSKTWLVPKPVSNFSRTKYNIQTPLNADTLLLRTKESPYIFSYINIIQTAYADTPFIRTLSKAPTMSVWTWLIRTYQQLTCTYINTNQVLNSSHQWNGSYWQEG